MFAILGGLGTPTHNEVVDYLNDAGGAGPVRLLRLPLLGRPRATTRTPSAGSPTTRSRARSSASTSRRTCPDKKVGLLPPGRRLRGGRREGRPRVHRLPGRRGPAVHLGQHRRGAADRRAPGERRRPGAVVHHPVVHRARAAGLAQGRLQADSGRLSNVGLRPDAGRGRCSTGSPRVRCPARPRRSTGS